MQAGKLRHRVTIRRATETVDSYGQAAKTYADLATVYAAVQPLTATELIAANQQQAMVTHKITMRYRSLLHTDQIIHDSRTFEIGSIINLDERNVTLEVLCKEKV